MEILLASPPGLFTDALSALVESLEPRCAVHRVADISAALASAEAALPQAVNLVLLDVDSGAGSTAIHSLSDRYPGVPIVALGGRVDDDFIDPLLDTGATGYLPKTYSESIMIGVLRLVLSGASYRPHLPKRMQTSALTATPAAGTDTGGAELRREFGLSDRQTEVLTLAAQGKSNQSIAKHLGITEGTVKLHMSAVFKALKVESRGEAALIATRMRSVNFRQMREAEDGRLDLDWLLPHMTHQRLRKDEIIFRKGDEGRRLYYLQRGTIRLEEIGAEITSGTLFGEIGIFSPTHERTCTAVCATDVDLFTLTDAQVKRLYFLNPQFAMYVVHLIATHLSADRSRAI